MGGWVTFLGRIEDLAERVERFRATFTVQGMTGPHIEVAGSAEEGYASVLWAWRHETLPDLAFVREDAGRRALLLSGVVTDMGAAGAAPTDEPEAARAVLDLLVEQGEEGIGALNGSFSLALFDPRRERATFVADRFASRSVWYARDRDVWIAGNIPSAVAAMMREAPTIDPASLWSLFTLGRHAGHDSLYDGVRSLPAGGRVVLRYGGGEERDFWRERLYEPDYNVKLDGWGWEAIIGDALRASAKRYARPGRNRYLYLSAGVGARISAAAMGSPLTALTLTYAPNAETRIAERVARELSIEHRLLMRTPHEYIDTLKAATLVGSGNHLNYHAHFITPSFEVALDDDGAEFYTGDCLENFGGHYFSPCPRKALPTRPEDVPAFFARYAPHAIARPERRGLLFRKPLREALRERYDEALVAFARRYSEVSENPADWMDTLLEGADPSLLPTFNMVTTLWPLVRERNLAFDNEVEGVALRIPPRLRDRGILRTRGLYNLAWRLVLIPDARTFLPPAAPRWMKRLALASRPYAGRLRRTFMRGGNPRVPFLTTSGSGLIVHELHRKDRRHRSLIERVISDPRALPPEIFDLAEVRATVDAFLAGDTSLLPEVEALITFGCLNRFLPTSGLTPLINS
jgi:hypothetical protein